MLITLLNICAALGIVFSDDSSNCNLAVSSSLNVTNTDCNKWCSNSNKKEFDDNCHLVKIKISKSDETVKATSCYDGWILGHAGDSEVSPRSLVSLKDISDVSLPQDCQSQCQQTDYCIGFQWKPDSSGSPNCFLKGIDHYKKARLNETTHRFDEQYCNPEETTKCIKNKNCKFPNHCIWCSKTWLTGPRVCPKLFSGNRLKSKLRVPLCTYDDKVPDEAASYYVEDFLTSTQKRNLLETFDDPMEDMEKNNNDFDTNNILTRITEPLTEAAETTSISTISIIIISLIVGLTFIGLLIGYIMYRRKKNRSRISDDLSDADTEEVPIDSQLDEYL